LNICALNICWLDRYRIEYCAEVYLEKISIQKWWPAREAAMTVFLRDLASTTSTMLTKKLPIIQFLPLRKSAIY
jgi:hypothetical protein